MLSFIVLALAFIGCQQVKGNQIIGIPNPNSNFIPGMPNPNSGYIPGMPNPFSCPSFPIIPYHYSCFCDLSHCLTPYIEAEAEILAQNTSYLSLCDIQQIFLLVQSVCPGIDPATEVSIVSTIVYALEAEIYNGDYVPMMPEYCNNYSGFDPFSPSSMFSSDYYMSFYNERMQYMLARNMPRLSDQLEATLRQTIEIYLSGAYEFDEAELYYKLCFCLRGILANMVHTTPYVY